MSLKIRMRRVGAKKQPAYRVVIADSRAPRDGRFVESLGLYNPLTHPSTLAVNVERALYWLRCGAQPTDVVKSLFEKHGIWDVYTGKASLESLTTAVATPEEVAPVAPVAEAAPAVEENVAPATDETPAAE